jgi:hypothetical protein
LVGSSPIVSPLRPSFERLDALFVPVELVVDPIEPSLDAFEPALDTLETGLRAFREPVDQAHYISERVVIGHRFAGSTAGECFR